MEKRQRQLFQRSVAIQQHSNLQSREPLSISPPTMGVAYIVLHRREALQPVFPLMREKTHCHNKFTFTLPDYSDPSKGGYAV